MHHYPYYYISIHKILQGEPHYDVTQTVHSDWLMLIVMSLKASDWSDAIFILVEYLQCFFQSLAITNLTNSLYILLFENFDCSLIIH